MEHSVCFIGHRKIHDTPELRRRLKSILPELIRTGTVNFIFGDHSAFDRLCYELVTEFKETYPVIRRINFRCDYPDADGYTMRFLIAGYEESICPDGRAKYAERNQAMIRESDVCIFYYDETAASLRRSGDRRPNSGTAIAFQYAKRKQKPVFNCFSAVGNVPQNE